MQVRISEIDIPEDRQRKILDEESLHRLAESINKHNLFNPILISNSPINGMYELVAGFRRLSAAELLGWAEIPAKFEEDLSPLERQIIELEENSQRENLTWAEESCAHAKIHDLLVKEKGKAVPGHGGGQSITATSEQLGVSKSTLAEDIKLADVLEFMPDLASLGKKQALAKIAMVQENMLREELTSRIKITASKVNTSMFDSLPGFEEEEHESAFFIDEQTELPPKSEGRPGVALSGPPGEALPDFVVYRENFTRSEPKSTSVPVISGQLILGNSLDVLKSMPDECIDLIVSDPPYGTAAARGGIQVAFKRPEGIVSIADFLSLIPEMYRIMREGHVYIFMAGTIAREIMESLHKVGFIVRWMPIVVVKRNVTILDVDFDFGSGYHTVVFARKGNRPFSKRGLISDVFTTKETVQSVQYSNQKPSDVIGEFIECSSDPNNVVLDPFMGSGTTCLAALRASRKTIGIDLNPTALSIAKERIQGELGDVVHEIKFEKRRED